MLPLSLLKHFSYLSPLSKIKIRRDNWQSGPLFSGGITNSSSDREGSSAPSPEHVQQVTSEWLCKFPPLPHCTPSSPNTVPGVILALLLVAFCAPAYTYNAYMLACCRVCNYNMLLEGRMHATRSITFLVYKHITCLAISCISKDIVNLNWARHNDGSAISFKPRKPPAFFLD